MFYSLNLSGIVLPLAYTSLESMAEAVAKAEVVLVSLSQKYKDSPACRTGTSVTVVGLLR